MKKKVKKIKVGIIFGGKSAEHEISIQSAFNVARALNKKKYQAIFIHIDYDGRWHLCDSVRKNKGGDVVGVIPSDGTKGQFFNVSKKKFLPRVDVAFPVLHGPCGEDGTVQGMLKLAGIPFVGSDVLGSALGMDKEFTKRVAREQGISIGKFLVYNKDDFKIADFEKIKKCLGTPIVIKPANMGSSVGVSIVKNKNDFLDGVRDAFKYDRKIIVEEYINGREVECSVLGNENPKASVVGEIIPLDKFYSYDAKYIDSDGARLDIPARISKSVSEKIGALSVKIFKTLGCEGMARVDFFLQKNGKVTFNEVNTIPGFTAISMYPKLWEASGITYSDLISNLIDLAVARFKKEGNFSDLRKK